MLVEIASSLAGGMEIKEVCAEYGLKREYLLAAIDYATLLISLDEVILLKA